MENTIIKNMLEKSEEAFLLALEIYNKPTIKYRLEGFAFFICNAWELLLKAKMIKEGKNIYYSDKPNRTINLTNCIYLVFTNDKDPIRRNLEIIYSLRNTATHFIIKELDSIYLPFMQANVLNYSQKLFDYFEIDITDKINNSFLTLVVDNAENNEEEILSRYGNEIFDRYLKLKNESQTIINGNLSDKLAININLNVRIVKDKNEAKTTFRIANDGENPVLILKEHKDTNAVYRYNQKRVRELVIENLKRKSIQISLTQYDLNLICAKFNLKANNKFYYYFNLTKTWGCSQSLVDFITELLIKDQEILDNLRLEAKNKKLAPGAKEF